jgi:hypothetical protein
MVPFLDWLIVQDTEALLRLLESADYFAPTEYNSVFNGELEKLAQSHNDPEVRQQVAALRGFDWGNYVSRSLVRAGFRGDDVQEQFHNIVVKLLLSPGKLFRGWNPAKHGPLERRFRASVWNAIKNVVEKNRNRRRWVVTADPAVMAERNPARQPYSGVLDEFRRLVAEKLGKVAAAILDQRLAGEDTKDLVGRPDLGSPGKFVIKREVQAIKKLAQRFAAQSGDVAFVNRVDKALSDEAATVAKRQQATAARRLAFGAVIGGESLFTGNEDTSWPT